MLWTCDATCTWEMFSYAKGGLEILPKVYCLPGCIDYQPVHSQKYLYSCLTELEMYQILIGIEWDTVWLCCQNIAYLSWLEGQIIQCHN